jgi:hypothetical protein
LDLVLKAAQAEQSNQEAPEEQMQSSCFLHAKERLILAEKLKLISPHHQNSVPQGQSTNGHAKQEKQAGSHISSECAD